MSRLVPRNNRAPWTVGDALLYLLWLGTVAAASWYALGQGLNADRLVFTLFLSSVIALGIYDTRNNQPTQYNLLRSWPFGSAADDELRGQQTVSSQALHVLIGVSFCLCLLQIAFRHQ